jgi:hypothetical protein
LKDVESAHKRGQKGPVRGSKEGQKSLYNYNLNYGVNSGNYFLSIEYINILK